MCYYKIDEIPSFFSSHSISSIINSLSHFQRINQIFQNLSIEFGFGFEGEFIYIDIKVAQLIIIKKWEAILKQS